MSLLRFFSLLQDVTHWLTIVQLQKFGLSLNNPRFAGLKLKDPKVFETRQMKHGFPAGESIEL